MQISPLVEQLIERLQSKEQLELEFKECRDALSNDIWETVSAFSNTQGGWLLLGIDNKGSPVGVNNPDRRVSELFSLGRNSQKISSEPWGEHDISIEQLDNYAIIVVRVHAAPRTKKPVYINGNPMTGTFVRRNEGDYHCKDDEVRRMFREASAEAIDSTVLKEFNLNIFDHETIARYRQRLQNRTPQHEFNDYSQERFLTALGAVDTSNQHPTIAGLLMFGTSTALRQWRKRHLIDYRLNAESISETTWSDRLAWDGNLFDANFKIYWKLTEGIQIPHQIEQGVRVDETPTHIALREALVNLLVHADYSETDASLVVKSPEGYFFRNPGSSRISEDDLFTGNRSDPRNPKLLFMFRLVGLAEEAGSGLPKIIRAWRSLGFQLPKIEIGTERYEFGIVLRNAHLISNSDRTWLQKLGGDLNEAEQLALVCAKHEEKIGNERLRTLILIHPSDATMILTGLRDKGLLKKESDRRGAYYKIPESLIEIKPTPSLFSQEDSTDVDKDLRENIENLRVENETLKDIRKNLKHKLSRVQKREFIRLYITKLCGLRPFSALELAKAFKMSPANLVTRYLNLLIREGYLQWTGKTRYDSTGKYVTLKKIEQV
ncbi:MAG: putative DNA binding domain-containing protein [Bacteroidota bacterium]|nr:putative DNA binding domain-containing protein [Bacteroidota bacterium]